MSALDGLAPTKASDFLEIPSKYEGGSSLIRISEIQHFRCQPEYSHDHNKTWALFITFRHNDGTIERKDVPAKVAKDIAKRLAGCL